MVVNPKRRCNMVAYQFPNFMVNNAIVKFVNELKYLGHVMSNSQLDDADIHRKRKNVFYRSSSSCTCQTSVCLSEMCQNTFRYSEFYSVTMMSSELALPRFEEIVEKCRCDLRQQMSCSNNGLVSLFSRLSVW